MILTVNLGERSYPVRIGRGLLSQAGGLLNLDRKVLVVTDSGVPSQYAQAVAAQAKTAVTVTVAQGETNKNLTVWSTLLDRLVEEGFTRSDCVVAVGGGVVGDMAGFAAATYLRGIDFYNVPTTLLAQLDSSVGGKVAVDHKGYKNLVGAFYQPKGVLIDPDVLDTLDARQLHAGAAEAVKVALTSDRELFELFESGQALDRIETVICRALSVKASVVERDETEGGLRRVLNFGHTVGHAIESTCGFSLLHGECVALGMLPMVCEAVRRRLLPVLESLSLPTHFSGDVQEILRAVTHDKKREGDEICAVLCPEVGAYEFCRLSSEELAARIGEASL